MINNKAKIKASLLMPPGKKTKKTLACVFAGTNVMGTWERGNRPVLIYAIDYYIQ